jgi:serine/threonine protein kinase
MTKQLSMIGYQIACGMIYLESKHIIHRDLHAGNILIDEQNIIRIADFEHAIIKDDDNDRFQQSTENSNLKFKIRRLAPECLPWPPETEEAINSNENILTEFSSKSDVWAYGLIFIELIIGTNNHVYPYLPQPDNDDVDDVEEHNQLIEYVKLGGNIHEKPHNCPEDLYNICKQCWKYYRDDRISFMDVRNEMLKLFKSKHK